MTPFVHPGDDGNDYVFFHAEYEGPVDIVVAKDKQPVAKITVPMKALAAFVAEYMRNKLVYAVETATPDEILFYEWEAKIER